MPKAAHSSPPDPVLTAERTAGPSPRPGRESGEQDGGQLGNADFHWERFDPTAYMDHNYKILRADDQQILERVRDHFSTHFDSDHPGTQKSGLVGADLGAGPNIYPALSMLPWAGEIRLIEHSPSNIDWLRGEVASYGRNWGPFWDVLCEQPAYAGVEEPRDKLKQVATVVRGSLFEPHREEWDLATMFFVAESISFRRGEFAAAVDGFLDGLRLGAPFAAAFMERSTGYEVGVEHFPAVPVTRAEVKAALAARTTATVERIGLAENPLRDGYTGMLVALGVKTAR
jgi:hypothetical protein